MTWSIEWGGRATDFTPELLSTRGKPGRVAQVARDALWEAVQTIGEHDSGAWVRATGNGWEDPDNPGVGQMTITVNVLGKEPSDIEQSIEAQQPHDLLSSREPITPPSPENPAQAASQGAEDRTPLGT